MLDSLEDSDVDTGADAEDTEAPVEGELTKTIYNNNNYILFSDGVQKDEL